MVANNFIQGDIMKALTCLLLAVFLSGCAIKVLPCASPFPDACRNVGAQIGGDGAGDSADQ